MVWASCHDLLCKICHSRIRVLRDLDYEFERLDCPYVEAFHDHAFGLADGIAAGECGLKLKFFIVNYECRCRVGGVDSADILMISPQLL